MLLTCLLVFHLNTRESESLTGKEIGYADINQSDIREEILGIAGTGLLPFLDEIELHLTALYSLYHQILNF